MTTATATPWPTAAEVEDVAARMGNAVMAIEDLGPVSWDALEEDLLNPDPPIPTPAQIGALSWFIANAEADIDNMTRYLAQIREARDNAATAMRGVGGGDDA